GTDPVGYSERGDGARINRTGGLETLLLLEGDQRLARARIEDSGHFAGQQAAFDQHLLHHADLLRTEVERGDAATAHAASAAEPRPRSGRNNVDHSAASLQHRERVA